MGHCRVPRRCRRKGERTKVLPPDRCETWTANQCERPLLQERGHARSRTQKEAQTKGEEETAARAWGRDRGDGHHDKEKKDKSKHKP